MSLLERGRINIPVNTARQIAHVLEDCFVAAQKGQLALGSDAVDVLLRAVDALGQIDLSGDGPGYPEAKLNQIVADLTAVRAGKSSARAAAPSTPPSKPAPAAPAAPARPAAPEKDARPVPSSGSSTLQPIGDLNAVEAEALRAGLSALLQDGAAEVRIDFGAVREVSPEGLVFLTRAARAASGQKPSVRLKLLNVASPVADLLRLTRLTEAFAATGGEH